MAKDGLTIGTRNRANLYKRWGYTFSPSTTSDGQQAVITTTREGHTVSVKTGATVELAMKRAIEFIDTQTAGR